MTMVSLVTRFLLPFFSRIMPFLFGKVRHETLTGTKILSVAIDECQRQQIMNQLLRWRSMKACAAKKKRKWVAYRAFTSTRWNPPGEKGPIYNR